MSPRIRPLALGLALAASIGRSGSTSGQGIRPIISPAFPIVGASGGQTDPALAYNPTSDTFLLAYRSGGEGQRPGGIRARRLNPQAQPLAGASGRELELSADHVDDAPAVAARDGTGEFLVTWSRAETDATNRDIMGQVIGPDPMSPPRPVSQRPGMQREPAAAYCPADGSYLVVWDEDESAGDPWEFYIFRQRVRADGMPIGPTAPASPDYPRPAYQQIDADIVYNPERGEYFVAFRDARFPDRGSGNNDDIFGQRLSCAGVPVLGDDLAISTQASPAPAGNRQNRPAVAYDSVRGRYLVVFDDMRNDPKVGPDGGEDELDIYGQLLDGDGTALGARVDENAAIATGPGAQVLPDVAFSPIAGAYLVVWSQETGARTQAFDIFGRFVDGGGQPLGPPMAITDAPGNQHDPAVVFQPGSRRFLVVWQDGDDNGTSDLAGAFVDPGTGGADLTGTPTPAASPTATRIPAPSATATRIPTDPATSTPTIVPTPTSTPTEPVAATPTADPTATQVAAPSATVATTPTPAPIYLPIVIRNVPASSIEFTHVPACGNREPLEGRVTSGWPRIDLTRHKVAVYLFADGGWWTKPYFDQPLIDIRPDGTWSCACWTGGVDHLATEIAAFLVSDSLTPPRRSGQPDLPPALFNSAVAHAATERPCQWKALDFSSRGWRVKASESAAGPGPNFFSDRPEDVFVDDQGRLHLRIASHDNRWYSSEVLTDQTLGYGVYTFGVDSRLDEIDPNAVLGLFTYDPAPDHSHREIDIEFSRWGDPGNDVGQYVVQPYTISTNMFRFPVGSRAGETTHRFDWRPGRIEYHSFYGRQFPPAPGDLIAHWVYSGAGVPPEGAAKARINLWLVNGAAPARGQALEVVINRFEFAPMR